MRLTIGAVTAAFLLLAAGLPSALGRSTRAADFSFTYTDTTGEDPAAADISSVVVSNDNAGNLTFSVNFANRTGLQADMAVEGYFDTDSNMSTGDTAHWGAEYILQLYPGRGSLGRWTGSALQPVTPAPSVSSVAGGVQARFNVAAIGGQTLFGFAVAAASGVTFDAGTPSYAAAHFDWLPNGVDRILSYELRTTATPPATTPTKPAKPKKKPVPKCKRGQKSTKTKPCRK